MSPEPSRARVRNQLFTAITRSKAWVRVLGVGPSMDKLITEYDEVKKRKFRLEFTYPNAEARRNLRIILRDPIRKRSAKMSKDLAEARRVLEAIERGDIEFSDVPSRLKRVIRDLFQDPK